MTRKLLILAGMTALSACTMEPKYIRPTPATPASWPTGDAYSPQDDAALPGVTYGQIFRDPKLQAIIARALDNNQDIRLALANVVTARGQLRVQRAQLLPQVDAAASASFRDSNNITSGGGASGSGSTSESYSANVGLSSFEIDLFGRLRSLSDAAFQEYLGTQAAVRAARLSLIAEVANAYLTLATDRSLLAIATDTEKSAGRSVELTAARLSGGVAPRTDLRQAETVEAQARADRADLTTLVAQDRNALELLVGAPVADTELPQSIESVDDLLGEAPAGLDSRILLRRPDVMQAEHQLRAANARIGAARAAFFPTISLTALAGYASTALSSLFSGGHFTWSVAPQVSAPLFDGGANAGNLKAVKGERDAAVATYQKSIQTAFREVSDALAQRGTISAKLKAQTDLDEAARDSYTLSEARYREGVDSFLSSLDAQRTYYSARRSLVSARLVRASNLVELYRALGGDTAI